MSDLYHSRGEDLKGLLIVISVTIGGEDLKGLFDNRALQMLPSDPSHIWAEDMKGMFDFRGQQMPL